MSVWWGAAQPRGLLPGVQACVQGRVFARTRVHRYTEALRASPGLFLQSFLMRV